MVEQIHTSPLAIVKRSSFQKNILLSVSGDDGLFYQAPLGAWLRDDSFVVYFHETAQMLERLRLYGNMKITAQFVDGTAFFAALHTTSSVANDREGHFAAIVQLHEECSEPMAKGPFFLPQT
jgi:hypothetical protein